MANNALPVIKSGPFPGTWARFKEWYPESQNGFDKRSVQNDE